MVAKPIANHRTPPCPILRVHQRRPRRQLAPVVAIQKVSKPRLPDRANTGSRCFTIIGVDLHPALLRCGNHITESIKSLVQGIGGGKLLMKGSLIKSGIWFKESPTL